MGKQREPHPKSLVAQIGMAWMKGFGTKAIARDLGRQEHEIYNNLDAAKIAARMKRKNEKH